MAVTAKELREMGLYCAASRNETRSDRKRIVESNGQTGLSEPTPSVPPRQVKPLRYRLASVCILPQIAGGETKTLRPATFPS